MHKAFLSIFTIIFFLCFTPIVFSASTSEIKNDCQVKVITEYLEPYQVKNSDGSLGGFSTEVVKALFKEANCKANFHVMPWARAYEVAQVEKNVMIYSMAHTTKRDPLFHWVGSLVEERLYFWGLKSKFSQEINDIARLKSYKVAASRNSNVAQYLIDHKFDKIYQLIKEDQNMMMLYRDRVELIVATELTLKNRAEKLGLDFTKMRKIKEVKALNNDLSLAFSLPSEPSIVLKFQQAFETIKANGTIQQHLKKWQIQ